MLLIFLQKKSSTLLMLAKSHFYLGLELNTCLFSFFKILEIYY